jgi:DNA-binding FadR family transcriptional regulator
MSIPDRTQGGDKSAIRLTPMKVPKASDVLANELRERILTGEFAEGTGLPAERDLVTQTRMSRTTVREALRILEVQGLIRIKAGRTGGAFVQQPGEEAMASTVNLLIRGRQIRLAALLETREAIEPFAARLAAVNRTDADLSALEAANLLIAEASGDLAPFLEANVEWHVAVARASHNEILSGLMVALSRAIYAATEDESFVDVEVRKTAVRAHETITAAIRDRDPDAAVRRMTRHVHSYAEEVLKRTARTDIDVP